MAALVVTVVCVAGLAVAAWLALRWGPTESVRPPLLTAGEPRPAGQVVARVARSACVGIAGGALAGVLVAGLGGRLVMRVMAATSGDAAQGLLTEAEETVGEVTLGGTIGLVVFVGLFVGMAGGLLYMAVRRWLPSRAWKAGLVFGLLLLAGTARLDAISPDNHDFAILRPAWLAVVLLTVLFLGYGLALGAAAERLARSYPLLSVPVSGGAVAAHVPLVLLVLGPPVLVVLVVATGVACLAQRAPVLARAWRAPAADAAGRVVLAVAGVAGAVWFLAGVGDILG